MIAMDGIRRIAFIVDYHHSLCDWQCGLPRTPAIGGSRPGPPLHSSAAGPRNPDPPANPRAIAESLPELTASTDCEPPRHPPCLKRSNLTANAQVRSQRHSQSTPDPRHTPAHHTPDRNPLACECGRRFETEQT